MFSLAGSTGDAAYADGGLTGECARTMRSETEGTATHLVQAAHMWIYMVGKAYRTTL